MKTKAIKPETTCALFPENQRQGQPTRGASLRRPFLGVIRMFAAGLAGFAGMTGCVGVHQPHPTGQGGANALHCDKCRTTWVTRAEPSGRITRFSRAEAMVCEDCESAVLHWLKSGKLKHYCSHCKGHMTCDPERLGAAPKK